MKTAFCPACAGELTGPGYPLGRYRVHPGCVARALGEACALEYARSYPACFLDYLEECLLCTDRPLEQAAARRLLLDFRDGDFGGKDFFDWVCDNR